MIPVTKPYFPDLTEIKKALDEIWQNEWITNNGPYFQRYEEELRDFFSAEHLLVTTNGTIALQIAIKALGLTGEIITTPFSYVATSSAIVWEGAEPVYVDIDPETFNIDPLKIEQAITPKTTAILATHCFGNPCDVDAIAAIAQKHGLRVIYDAAHCFGTNFRGESIMNFGDVSTLSLHATKLIHCGEGGAIITKDSELNKKMWYMRNFGHDGPGRFQEVGVNGKNSELHAALGSVVLRDMKQIFAKRKDQSERYDLLLQNTKLRKQRIHHSTDFNYAYYPVVFQSGESRARVQEALKQQDILARRYFYPSLSSLPYVSDFDTPLSDALADTILCLPLFHTLTDEDQQRIGGIILGALAA